MRFAKGVMYGILGFFLYIVASIFGAFSYIGEYGLGYDEVEVSKLNPFWLLLILLGFFLMVGAPIYYWIIEPIFRPHKANYILPLNHVKRPDTLPVRNSPYHYKVQQNKRFCINCGSKNIGDNFCSNCGQKF